MLGFQGPLDVLLLLQLSPQLPYLGLILLCGLGQLFLGLFVVSVQRVKVLLADAQLAFQVLDRLLVGLRYLLFLQGDSQVLFSQKEDLGLFLVQVLLLVDQEVLLLSEFEQIDLKLLIFLAFRSQVLLMDLSFLCQSTLQFLQFTGELVVFPGQEAYLSLELLVFAFDFLVPFTGLFELLQDLLLLLSLIQLQLLNQLLIVFLLQPTVLQNGLFLGNQFLPLEVVLSLNGIQVILQGL